MTLTVFCILLFAALLHASWNAIVKAIGGPHGARRAGTTERLGQLTVVHHLAAGDFA